GLHAILSREFPRQPLARCYAVKSHSVSILCDHAEGSNGLEIWFEILNKIEALPGASCIECRVGSRPTCRNHPVSVRHSIANIANGAHKPIVFSRDSFKILMVGTVSIVKKNPVVVSDLIKIFDNSKRGCMSPGSRPCRSCHPVDRNRVTRP